MTMQERFKALHEQGTFVMPNPWDVGSAKILESLGFEALATTSAGHAATLGKTDQQVTLVELLDHAEDLVAAIDVPLNLDSERCFGESPEDVFANVIRMAETGAAGCSYEDFNPVTSAIDPLNESVERMTAAGEAANATGMTLTGRCENHLYGVDDLDDTIARLLAYEQAGAHVLYAPGLPNLAAIERVVNEVTPPVNVLATAPGPSVRELGVMGVRRISTGSGPARAAYAALVHAAEELRSTGTSHYTASAMPFSALTKLFAT